MKQAKITILILTLAVTSSVIISGCGKKPEDKQITANNQVENQDKMATTTEQIPPKEEIDTSDWKAYRNEEYGLEVKYPEGWEINESDGINIFSKEQRENYPESGGAVVIKIENRNLDQFIEMYNNLDIIDGLALSKIIKQEKIIFDNIQSVLMIGTTAIGINNNFIYLTNKDRNYLISYHEFDNYHKKIISTIKFVE